MGTLKQCGSTHPQHVVMVSVTRVQSAPKPDHSVAVVLQSAHQSAVLLRVGYWCSICVLSVCVLHNKRKETNPLTLLPAFTNGR